ncbi:hypothetical protein VP01_2172g1 [Puccinia sorghi]|uniref:Uncharacterized protein n=1 Tax=Puccinia sorghi TaxID=27349 RepID=A0A0L6VBA1_9BASI|nr:hypothetical protein VP01_2172g1 [Puccinia sorghi]
MPPIGTHKQVKEFRMTWKLIFFFFLYIWLHLWYCFCILGLPNLVILGPLYARDQTAPEDRKELGDIFTSTVCAIKWTGNDSPMPAEDIDNEEWPYSPTQALPEGQTQHDLGATSEHADLTNELQTSGRKRKVTLDEDAEFSCDPPGSLGRSTIHSGSQSSANMITTRNNKTVRKTNKLEDKTLGNSIAKTLNSFARMNMPGELSFHERKKRKYGDIIGGSKGPSVQGAYKTYPIDNFFSLISTYIGDKFPFLIYLVVKMQNLDKLLFNSMSAHEASNLNIRTHYNNFHIEGERNKNSSRANLFYHHTRALHQSHMPLLIPFCNIQHTPIHINARAAEFLLLMTQGKLVSVFQRRFNTPIVCSTTTCCNDKRLNFLCGRSKYPSRGFLKAGTITGLHRYPESPIRYSSGSKYS